MMPWGRVQTKAQGSSAPPLVSMWASVYLGIPAKVPAEEGAFPVNSVGLLRTEFISSGVGNVRKSEIRTLIMQRKLLRTHE